MRIRSIVAMVGVVLGMTTVGNAAVVQLHPSQDNSIYSESDNSNALGGLFAGRTPNLTVRRALIQFDLSSIPAGSTITSVAVAVAQTKIGPGVATNFELRPVSKAWGVGTSIGTGSGGVATAGDATWNFSKFNSASWSTPGGDFGTVAAATSFGTASSIYTFSTTPSLVANVQSWLDSPSTNFGWLLKASDETVTSAREFGSMESSSTSQPVLTVNFTAPVPEPTSAMLLCGTAISLMLRKRSRMI